MLVARAAVSAALTVFLVIIALIGGASLYWTYVETNPVRPTTMPAWFFDGAYANYSGSVCTYYPTQGGPCGATDNYSETTSIRIVQFNVTKVEYSIDTIPAPGVKGAYNGTRFVWMYATLSVGYLLCQDIQSPSLLTLSAANTEIPAFGYFCFVEPNDYGTVYLGEQVPFILGFTHSITVGSLTEGWRIVTTNIPGLI